MNYDYEIRQYRDGDYESIAGFWELTGMGSPERGDSKKVVEDTIKLGGSLLVMEEKTQDTSGGK